jgi:hypothetical protein
MSLVRLALFPGGQRLCQSWVHPRGPRWQCSLGIDVAGFGHWPGQQRRRLRDVCRFDTCQRRRESLASRRFTSRFRASDHRRVPRLDSTPPGTAEIVDTNPVAAKPCSSRVNLRLTCLARRIKKLQGSQTRSALQTYFIIQVIEFVLSTPVCDLRSELLSE